MSKRFIGLSQKILILTTAVYFLSMERAATKPTTRVSVAKETMSQSLSKPKIFVAQQTDDNDGATIVNFRDVFKNMSPELNAMLEEQVEASRQVSAMAAVVAEMTDTVDPQAAAMAGLLHNVGVLPLFGYATRNVAYAMNSRLVARAIERLSDQVGVLIAKKWRFGDELISTLEWGSNWTYDPGEKCDLVSVIVTAKYHYALSKSGLKGLPKPKDVPSLAAVSQGNFNEEFSFKILEGAKV